MFRKLILTFFLLFSSFTTIYPSKKENTNLFDYCYSFEKILSRNSVVKNKNLPKNYKSLAKDITLFGINNTKGALAYKIVDQYKTSKNLFILNVVPNQFYCLAGYWIEQINPGKFQSIFLEISNEKINDYKDIKKEVDDFFKNFNSEYESIKIEIKNLF